MLTTPELAMWLAEHVSAIAASESAAQCYAEVDDAVKAIERAINRPVPPRFLGPCPKVVTENYGTRVCNTLLTAEPDDVAVQCPSCRETHRVDKLIEQQVEETGDKSFTLNELTSLILPALREPIPRRTLQQWIVRGKLTPTGWDADGEPRYLLNNVRNLREQKPQKVETGAAAHRKRRRA